MTDGDIILSLGTAELLCQLAEEAAELSQAALKLRRALDGKNPTPKSVEDCEKDLAEEAADVRLCMAAVILASGKDLYGYDYLVDKIGREKAVRWRYRLEAVQDDKQVQQDV